MAQYGKPSYWDERYTKCVARARVCVHSVSCSAHSALWQIWLGRACAAQRGRLRSPPLPHSLLKTHSSTPHPSSFRHRASCRDPEAFDWYQRYAGIKEQLTVYAEKTDRILNLGCGNSRASCSSSSLLAAAALLAASLRVARGTHPTSPISSSPFSPHAPSSPTVRAPARTSPPSSSYPPPLFLIFFGAAGVSEEMYEDGYTTIDNIDISDVVIQAMQAKHSDKTGLTWEVMDCTALNHPDGIYDVVFDKGTVDSLLCGEGSTAKVATVCAEVSRVLKDDGTFFMVSYGIPDNRLSYLENADYNWTVKVHAIPKPTVTATAMMESKDATSVHYIYVCSKGDDSGK